MLNFFKPRPKKADTLSLIAQSCQLTAEFMTSQISKDVYDKLLRLMIL